MNDTKHEHVIVQDEWQAALDLLGFEFLTYFGIFACFEAFGNILRFLYMFVCITRHKIRDTSPAETLMLWTRMWKLL